MLKTYLFFLVVYNVVFGSPIGLCRFTVILDLARKIGKVKHASNKENFSSRTSQDDLKADFEQEAL